MCGIAGFSGDFDPSLLDAMNSVQSHRGPDDDGIFHDPHAQIGLAHRRLSILDLSDRGHQPMWDAAGNCAIVFNGEIFNFRDLRDELESDGFRFRSDSDTEVLVNLYLRHGEAMLDRLNGQYAFAVWDRRAQQLFLARDRFGIKPLYYTTTAGGFLFASELKALLCEDAVSREFDFDAIRDHLTYLWCPAPHTMFRSIRKLEPGHAMIVGNGRIEREWSFQPPAFGQPIKLLPLEDAVEQVRSTLRSAVQRQLISDVPVGAFLSGGLDSSAIVSFAREWAPARLQCFTIANSSEAMASEGFEDDLPYARQVAEDLDIDLHVVEASPKIAADLERMVYQLDEPVADPACLNVLFLSRIAAQNGVKVLLSGTGADDIFAGYRRHRAILLERYWRWLPKRARTAFARSARRLPQTTAAARRLSRAFHYADVDGDERIASYFFWTDPTLLDRLCGPALRDASSTPISLPLITALQELPATVPPINRMLALDQRFFLADHNLNYLDKMSMAAGVEARVPFLDPELVALASRLPVVYKQRGRTGKWILRKAMQGLLPDTVISRPKTGFGAPVRRWLRNELQPWVDDLCSTQALQDRGLFDPAAVQQLIRDDRAGRIDASYTIFSIICIELWCRQFLPARVAKSQTLRLSS